jgi:type IV secretory pathway TrbD component
MGSVAIRFPRNGSRDARLEGAINTFLAFAIPIAIYLVVSQVVRYAIAAGLVLWLVVYVRRFKQARGRHPLKPE